MTATDMPPPRALYHSILHVRRIQMVHFTTRSDRWWWSYLLVCTFFHRATTYRLFAAECYKYATASSLIPLNSSCRAESNERSPGSGAPLAGGLSPSLTQLTATGMPPPRALYHSIRLVRRTQMGRFTTRSDRWWWSYLLVCTFVHWASTYRLFAAECYKYATASSLIPLNSSCRAESNELSPGTGVPLAGELSPFLTLLTATGMPPPRALYHSIRLVRRILMACSPALADPWPMSYHFFSPDDSYRHATTSSLIPFDSCHPAGPNGPLPGPGGPLADELSLLFT